MSSLEPVGGLYEIVVEDSSVTASGLVLSGSVGTHVIAKVIQIPTRRRMNQQGFFPPLMANIGERVLIAKANVVELKVGLVDTKFTSDESIIGIVR